MKITKEVIEALEKAKVKMKKIEAKPMPKEFRADSAWLNAINDIINRTILVVRDELEVLK